MEFWVQVVHKILVADLVVGGLEQPILLAVMVDQVL
jgi:hypothetical protein